MKLCPQCEFIYEDDQSCCDMDGKELVYDPGPLAFEDNAPARSPELHEPAAIPVNLTRGLPASPPRWQYSRSAVVTLAAILLMALLFVVYYARTHQPRSGNTNQASNQTPLQASNQHTQPVTDAQGPAPDLASATPESLTPSSEQSSSASENVTTSSPSSVSISSASYNRGRMLSNPVSAGGSAANTRAPVIVWLTNGASIKADEAWEKREGIWYRQAGMVTFLKRSRVRSIQRRATPSASSKSTAINAEKQTSNAIARNQLRPGKPEAVGTKKESRVSSFLKKTGRILKKPFKF